MRAGGSRLPGTVDTLAAGDHYFRMEGRDVVEFVRAHVPSEVDALLAENNIRREDIRHVVTHQANGNLVRVLVEDLGLTGSRLHTTVERYGNTGAASVAITLDDAIRAGGIDDGELTLLVAFGGGMSIGLAMLRR